VCVAYSKSAPSTLDPANAAIKALPRNLIGSDQLPMTANACLIDEVMVLVSSAATTSAGYNMLRVLGTDLRTLEYGPRIKCVSIAAARGLTKGANHNGIAPEAASVLALTGRNHCSAANQKVGFMEHQLSTEVAAACRPPELHAR
jgi:hypothetical protein